MLTSSQLKNVLNHIINNNRVLESAGQKKSTVQVVGESGIGKTSIILQVAEERGMKFSKYNPSQTDDAGDITGMPIREFECITPEGDNVWINEKALDHAPAGVKFTGKMKTNTCAPSWVPQEPGTLLLIDDWNRAHLHIIQALMEIVDRGESVGWSLPPDTHIFLSSNPDDGKYFVTSLDDAQKTRYTSVQLKFDVEEWAKWAEYQGIDTRCINFLLLNPEMIDSKKGVNSRLATQFFNNLYSMESLEGNLAMIKLLGEGSVGEEFTSTFILFINNRLDKIPSPQYIFDLNQKDEDVIKTLNESCGKIETKHYKANIASVISTRMINYTNKLIDDKNFDTKRHVERIKNIILGEVFMKDINLNVIKTLNTKKQLKTLINDNDIITEVLA